MSVLHRMKAAVLGTLALVCLIAAPAAAKPPTWTSGVMSGHVSAASGFVDPGSLGAKVPFWIGAQYAGDLTVSGGTTVTGWLNKGTNGGTGIVTGGGCCTSPTLRPAALNGKNAVGGDGANPGSALDWGSQTFASGNYTVFIILKHHTNLSSEYEYVFQTGSSTPNVGLGLSSTAAAGLWWTGQSDAINLGAGYSGGQTPHFGITAPTFISDTTSFHHIEMTLGAANSFIQDGSTLTKYDNLTGAVPAVTSDHFYLFWSGPNSGWGAWDIAELIICVGCTAGDITNIDSYLSAQWGLWFCPIFIYRRRRGVNDNDAIPLRRAA